MVIGRAVALALVISCFCNFCLFGVADVEANEEKNQKLLTISVLRQLQDETGLSLLTIDDGCVKYIDFATAKAKTLYKLKPEMLKTGSRVGSEFHYCLDYSHKLLAGSREREKNRSRVLYVANLADDSVTIYHECYPLDLSLSPSGRFIAYITQTTEKAHVYEVWRLDLPTRANELISSHSVRGSVPQWSSDERFILFNYKDEQTAHSESAIAVYDTRTKNERVLTKNAFRPTWKPLTEQYVFFWGGDVFQSTLDKSDVRDKIAIKSTTPVLWDMPIRFSESGDFMAYLRGSPRDILNIKGFSEVELMVKGKGDPVRVFGPYDRAKKLNFFWAEVPEAKTKAK